jgi:hypothetical protein
MQKYRIKSRYGNKLNVALARKVVALPKLPNLSAVQSAIETSSRLSDTIGQARKVLNNTFTKDVVTPVSKACEFAMGHKVSEEIRATVGNSIAHL